MTTTYGRLADLPLQIDGYALDGLTRRVSTAFRRFTTVFRLTGAGLEGVGAGRSRAPRSTWPCARPRRLNRAVADATAARRPSRACIVLPAVIVVARPYLSHLALDRIAILYRE